MTAIFKILSIFCGVFILSAAGIAKIYSGSGSINEPILSEHNPLIFVLTYRQTLIFSGVLELLVGVLLMTCKVERLRMFFLLAMAVIFSSYRIGLWVGGYTVPCGCLGMLPNKLGLGVGNQTALVNLMFAAYMVVSLTYAFLVMRYHGATSALPNSGSAAKA